MRPVTISLDPITWELSKKKSNFSAWVRDQLRAERNRRASLSSNQAVRAQKIEELTKISTVELLYHLEQRSDEEITALVSILQGSLPQQ
jgi:hypothetical protein